TPTLTGTLPVVNQCTAVATSRFAQSSSRDPAGSSAIGPHASLASAGCAAAAAATTGAGAGPTGTSRADVGAAFDSAPTAGAPICRSSTRTRRRKSTTQPASAPTTAPATRPFSVTTPSHAPST